MKLKYWFFGAAVFVILILNVTESYSQNDEWVNDYQRGRQALDHGDYVTAILSFEEAIKLLDIDPVEAGERYRKLLSDMEGLPNDLTKPRHVVGFLKEWLDCYYYLGLAYAHKGDKTSALKQAATLRTIGRTDYADSLELEIAELIK